MSGGISMGTEQRNEHTMTTNDVYDTVKQITPTETAAAALFLANQATTAAHHSLNTYLGAGGNRTREDRKEFVKDLRLAAKRFSLLADLLDAAEATYTT